MFEQFGRLFLLIGGLFLLVGLAMLFVGRLGLGSLPGDIVYRRGNFTLYFPIVTSILLSLILSAVFWILGRR